VLDEPNDSPTSSPEQTPAPAKATRRRRATKAATAPLPGSDTADSASAGDRPGADTAGATGSAPASGADVDATSGSQGDPLAVGALAADVPAQAAPAKRTRKAATRKAGATPVTAAQPDAGSVEVASVEVASVEVATTDVASVDAASTDAASTDAASTDAASAQPAVAAPGAPGAAGTDAAPPSPAPRKRTPRKRTAPPPPPPEEIPLTEEELAAQAALLAAGEPVVAAVEDDPVVQQAAADDVPTAAAVPQAPAELPAEEEAPARRTRTRRAVSVTFQAPEPVAEPVATAVEQAADPDAPTPRRRRRAGTSGALSPSALVPELIEPVPAPVDGPLAEPAGGSGPEELEDDDEAGDRPRRRRRGRRGRGPRRPEDDASEDGTDEEQPPSSAEVTDDPDETSDDEAGSESGDEDDQPSGTRRRRRRRRSGSAGATDELAEDVPTVVREPREPRSRSRSGATSADEDGVRGITGSTRMAAKRVRRQEGRDSGRGRKPILSEAEFLARREAVERTMIVRQKGDRTQIAVLEDGILVEHYVTRASAQSYAGNVYLGRVQNVLPSMEAAFVDIGKSRNAVLYAGEVNYNASAGGRSRSIESVLKSGQEVLVQVSKDPIGSKGSRLTGQVSLPGRYLVYVPEGTMTGISRKLPETERERLKKILKKVVPEGAGVIIRTAAEGASEEEISADVRRLQAQWEVIQAKAAKGGAPALLHAEPDLVIRVVRDVFNEDFHRLVVQGDSEWATIRDYVEFVAPELAPRLSRHTSVKDVFAEHRVDEQLLKALDRKVYLPSGGSLVIDRTEAMVVIDVNTGKFVGKGGNLEETVTRNNLEAAEEIARQLRLRDVGGIIVVDFIDMVLESNRDLVVRRLVECLGRDRTKHQVAEVTSLGLVQMTRKRVGQGLLESFSEPCESCNGRGVHVHPEPVDEGRGGSSEDESRRAPRRKPIPPDAPKPRSAVLVPAVAGAAAAPSADGVAPDEDALAVPRRRRRGGRGTGSATVAPDAELSELLAGGSSPAADAVRTVDELVAVAQDVVPVLADHPAASAEDLPVDLAPNEVVGAVVDAERELGNGLPARASDEVLALDGQGSDGHARDQLVDALPGVASPAGVVAPPAAAREVAAPEVAAQAAPEPAAPKRRRRATSRPAGPPV